MNKPRSVTVIPEGNPGYALSPRDQFSRMAARAIEQPFGIAEIVIGIVGDEAGGIDDADEPVRRTRYATLRNLGSVLRFALVCLSAGDEIYQIQSITYLSSCWIALNRSSCVPILTIPSQITLRAIWPSF